MIKANDCLQSLATRRLLTRLSLALSVLQAGCSSISGLRSVGPERPSLLGLWDRPTASPAPENDAYVISMRAGQARAAELAKANRDPAPGPSDNGPSDGEKLADGAETGGAGRRNAPKTPLDPDDNTIRVSLGRPEPLPGVSLASTMPPRHASKDDDGSPPKPDENDSLASNHAEPPRDAKEPVLDTLEPAGQGQQTLNADWKTILSRAEAKVVAMQTYQMRVTRLERVNGQAQPEEEIVLSVRRDPKAVRLEWASGPHKGREVIYSSSLDPRMIFVHMPPGAIPLPVMKIAVDSPLVMRNSRHAITEAGMDTIVENLRKAERGDKSPSGPGVLSYQGTEKPAGLARTCHHFVRRTATGETWNVYLDEQTLLPSMVYGQDSHGAVIERYVYREIRESPSELASASAFEPDRRWAESKGLLSRFARAAGTSLPPADASSTR